MKAALWLLAAALACAQAPASRLLEDKLLARIRAYDAQLGGALGVAAIDLTTGRAIAYHGDAQFATASSIKVAILVEAFRTLKLDQTLTLRPAEAVGGSGVLAARLAQGPVTLTVRELLTHMIEASDNTATNRAIAMVKMERVNALVASQGLRGIRLRRVMMDSAAAKRGEENVATPLEMARFWERLYRGQLANPEATARMIAILKRVRAELRKGVPAEVEVASKPGELTGVECEAGVVYLAGRPFVLSIYGSFLEDGAHPVRDIAAMVYAYFEKLSLSNAYGNRVGR